MARVATLILWLLAAAVATGQASFTDVTDSAGVVHQYRVHEGLFGGGACVIDFNQDGLEDVYLTGGLADDQLLRNNGDGTLTDVFAGSGLELTRHFVTQGGVTADVNRDGYADLFVTTITSRDSLQIIPRARNLLFLGSAAGTFRDATEAFGLYPLYSFSTGASFGDVNQDGWPDLYVGNYFVSYEEKLDHISDATIVGAQQTARGYLLLNDQGRRFVNVYADYGLDHRGFGFGAVFTDYDNDGDQDLLVNHDFGYKATPDLLLRNEYPRKRFTDVAEEEGLDLRINSMGAAVGDYDNNGYLDYYVTNIKFNRFMVADPGGEERFVDRTKELGMTYVSISWGANFADYDQDGDLDLFVSNGDLNPNCVPMANFYFDNLAGERFEERARATGLADYGIGRGSVVFDLENDGDLDLLAVCQGPVLPGYPVGSTTRLWRNDTQGGGNFLKVRLRGTSNTPTALGARAVAYVKGVPLLREIDGGSSSHLSHNSNLLHFGLGAAERVDSLLIRWNGGQEQWVYELKAGQLVTVEQEVAAPSTAHSGWPMRYWLTGIGLVAVGLLAYFFLVQRQRTP